MGFVGISVLMPLVIKAQAELDVLVVYTQAVEDYYGDEDGVLAHIQSSFSSANLGFGNSDLSIRLVLRDWKKISYVEGSSLPDDLTHITNSSEVAALRDQVGADLVCLFRSGNIGGYSGYGWILNSESGDSEGGFSVVGAQSAISTLTFQHEIGHNLGAAHDRNNASIGGLYPYSYGYRFVGSDSTQYRTIMAYAPGQNINFYSNPNVDYQGTRTGIASGVGSADNARTYSMTSSVVEDYRERVVDGSNSSPTLVQPIPSQVAFIGVTFDLDVSSYFDDVDTGDTLDFSATLMGGAPLPSWLSLNASTGVFSGTPSESDLGVIQIKTMVSDGEASVSHEFEVDVQIANELPVLVSPIDDQIAIADTLFTLDVSTNFDDSDEDPLQFLALLESEEALPEWLSIDLETGVFSGMPSNADIGLFSILVVAFDGEEGAVDVFLLEIVLPNEAPTVIQSIPDQIVNEDTLLTLDVSSNFGDADLEDTLSFTAILATGADIPVWLEFDSVSGVFSGTPFNDDVGSLSIEVRASDGEYSVADGFMLTVNNTNDTPFLSTPIPDQSVFEDNSLELDVSPSFSDLDTGTILAFSSTLEAGGSLPSWLSIVESSGVISGIPSNDDLGTYSIEVTASDGELSVSDVFALVVENVNDRPVVRVAIPDQNTDEDVLFSLDVSPNFDDPDSGTTLTFSATLEGGGSLPSWLAIGEVSGVITGTPSNDDIGTHSIEVTVSDGELSVADVFILNVDNLNDNPVVLIAIPDQSTDEDVLFSLDLSPNFDDPDSGTILTFSASLEDGGSLPNWLAIGAESGLISGTPSNDDIGAHSIEVTVSDGELSVSDVFTLNVDNINDSPVVLIGIPDQYTDEDALFSLDVSPNFVDPDSGTALAFTATMEVGESLPSWLAIGEVSGVITGTPSNDDVGSYSVVVTASDREDSVSDIFEIQVLNINDSPIVRIAPEDQFVREGEWFQFLVSGFFDDPDEGDSFTYSAALNGGELLPDWLEFDQNVGVFRGVPSIGDAGLLKIDVTVSDGVDSVSTGYSLHILPWVIIEKIDDTLFLELYYYNRAFSYVLWKSKDLVDWELSEIPFLESDGKLVFEIPGLSDCFYRVELSE